MNCEHYYLNRQGLLSSTTEQICPLPPSVAVSSGSVGSVDIDIGCWAQLRFQKEEKACWVLSRSQPRSQRWSAARARARYSAPLTLSWYHLSHFSKDFSCQFVIIPGHGSDVMCDMWGRVGRAASVSCTHRAVSASHIALLENSEQWGKWGRVHVSMHYLSWEGAVVMSSYISFLPRVMLISKSYWQYCQYSGSAF